MDAFVKRVWLMFEGNNPTVQAAVISAVAVLLSGLLTLFISAHFSRRSLLDEWAQRNKEWERERRKTNDEWLREKIIGYYSEALYYLIKLNMSAVSKEKDRAKQVRQHVAESQRYLNLLGIYRTEYADKLADHRSLIAHAIGQPKVLESAAQNALDLVKEILETDKRVGEQERKEDNSDRSSTLSALQLVAPQGIGLKPPTGDGT